MKKPNLIKKCISPIKIAMFCSCFILTGMSSYAGELTDQQNNTLKPYQGNSLLLLLARNDSTPFIPNGGRTLSYTTEECQLGCPVNNCNSQCPDNCVNSPHDCHVNPSCCNGG
ncbi:hypothetical protein [Spartinivicinus ruber]|uniref:hypothetical protein n=1 Tax=Spartinivicinus ruber TaxID=2683272 RepID=UPI0013D79967|nr:hypothetical protein [Spartinivicinus ruber]